MYKCVVLDYERRGHGGAQRVSSSFEDIFDAESLVFKESKLYLKFFKFFDYYFVNYYAAMIFFYMHVKKEYDLIIINHPTGLVTCRNKNKAIKLYYCHTPTRAFYLASLNYSIKNSIKKFIYWPHAVTEKILAVRANYVVANSEHVRNRIVKFYGLRKDQVEVIYPPVSSIFIEKSYDILVDTQNRKSSKLDPYFISYARLASDKRIEIILQFFANHPEYKIIFISDGPLSRLVKDFAVRYPNIEYFGPVSDEELLVLISEATASIYIPYEEDFGLTPVEATLLNTPSIVTDEGGLRETISENKNGIKISPTMEGLLEGVKNINTTVDAEIIVKFRIMFSQQRFKNKILNIVHSR